jgi:hypothetical protein
MQSIFSAPSRRETARKPFEGGRRDGALKIDWTKPPPRAWLMGIVCRLDLGQGPEALRDGQHAGLPR